MARALRSSVRMCYDLAATTAATAAASEAAADDARACAHTSSDNISCMRPRFACVRAHTPRVVIRGAELSTDRNFIERHKKK